MTTTLTDAHAAAARATWQALEPVHAMVYFAKEAQEEYAALGFDVKGNRASGYFPARAAAMGAVSAPVVQATFYNFSPLAVLFGMQGAWDVASPADVQAARWRGAERALVRLLGEHATSPAVAEVGALLEQAATACRPDGRPLYAANAGLEWPDTPLLRLFHAQTLLREHRGDGHIATLVSEGVTGLQAAVLHVAVGDSWTRAGLQATRAYSDEEWEGAVAELAERGWLNADGSFTDAGRAHRQHVEEATDRLAAAPYAALGEDACAKVRELGAPLGKAVLKAGGLGLR